MIITAKFLTHAIAGAAAATAVQATTGITDDISPWLMAFSANSLISAFFGALGGLTRWVFLRELWWDGLRLLVLGAIVAFGIGGLWPLLVKTWVGDIPNSVLAHPQVGWWGAYFVGLLAVVIVGRFIDEKNAGDSGGKPE